MTRIQNKIIGSGEILSRIDFTNREYDPASCLVICRVKEPFGGLLNMSSEFPLTVNGLGFKNLEALYQCLRYTALSDVQRRLIEFRSPLMSKYYSLQFRDRGRKDWDGAKVSCMEWCLHVKLACNYDPFGQLLASTGEQTIVEVSPNGDFWGGMSKVKGEPESPLCGANVLGQLLMHLWAEFRATPIEELLIVGVLDLPDFLLLGEPIRTVDCPL